MGLLTENQTIQNVYQQRCASAREKFATQPVIQEVFEKSVEPKLFQLFMIFWSAMSAGITKPIPLFLEHAGKRCQQLGLSEVADFFYEHAHEEDGHENWANDDVQRLVELWNKQEPKLQLNAQELLEHSSVNPIVKRYHKLHENIVEGASPWAELAIDVEIELISTQYGSILVKRCLEYLGTDSLPNVSFLDKHVSADVGHTETNFKVVQTLLDNHPEFADCLIETAFNALDTYAALLEDSLHHAKVIFARLSPSSI